jgi:pullulanase-type alpha-1,6-glucosidase
MDPIPIPQIVAIASTFQDELGCPGDWNTDCPNTYLTLDANSLLYRGTFLIPAGSHEYKVALNGSWDDNFGLGGVYYGLNIPLELSQDTLVTFFYSHETMLITDNVNHITANVPGSFQDEIGCASDWAPDCLRTWLQDPDGDGVYYWATTWIPAGDYEAKVAVNESWAENYGADGAPDGANIPFTVGEFEQVLFQWDSATKLMTITTFPAPEGSPTSPPQYPATSEKPQPASVSIPGTLSSVLGCPGDWQPECPNGFLTFDPIARIWTGSFDLPAGNYEYKAALNGSWDANFGLNAAPGGPNIPLALPADQTVKFYYDHQTGWITDNINTPIYTVTGNFQTALGCPADHDPACLVGWLEDPAGTGIFSRLLHGIPPGTYTAAVNLGETPNPLTDPAPFTVDEEGAIVFMQFDPATGELKIQAGAPKGDLTRQQAHWVTRDTLAWDIDTSAAVSFQLVTADWDSPDASGLQLDPSGIIGDDNRLNLTLDPEGLPAAVTDKFPHLEGYAALKIDPGDLGENLARLHPLLKGQLAIIAYNAEGKPVDATGIQIPGVLDDLYPYDGALGLTWSEGIPTFRVWAPTAKDVTLNIYPNSGERTFPQARSMSWDMASGVWSYTGEAGWEGKFYAYEVLVYVPSSGAVETNVVTDPYSAGLSTNGFRSLIVDLNDPALFPADWADTPRPPLEAPEDIVIYEMHLRDFSVNDATVPEALRGTFLAFTVLESNGMQHLRALAEAGLTHLHLLPVFDIASVDEDKSTWAQYDFANLASLPPDSQEQQAAISPADAFNWGYDPVHFGVPDGAYATDPEGAARILEFRQMVQALHQSGLRVVMDVVYNHTNASGQRPNSVLDKIVPGYYHRLNDKGQVETSTCCQNTASEHAMMRKLMVDMSVMWATAYNVDGFRFDLMGHHMVGDMLAVRDALHAIDPTIYVYGEGWDFGEVAGGSRGLNATQLNLAGTGIGTFNDRVRDSVRGGSPFGGQLEQGFATGLYTDPNESAPPASTALTQLLLFSDRIRAALAGNLADFTFIGASGAEITSANVDYNGSPTGYTQDPQEHIAYISAHDNEIWFDAVQYKAPAAAAVADRVRMHNLGIDLVMLSQGIPFFTAGDDMLRSKSFDRDSYNSGDWFNRLDFTYTDNGFGSGLPAADKNQDNWDLMQPLLANPHLKPAQADILAAVEHFREMLAIRKSSPLFRLQTADDIAARLTFQNTGPDQLPGLIVMTLSDSPSPRLDTAYRAIIVLFNANPGEIAFTLPEAAGEAYSLHPIQQASADETVRAAGFDAASGTFTIPGRTTAVFVLPDGAVELDPSLLPPTSTPGAPSPTATPRPTATPAADKPAGNTVWFVVLGISAALFAGMYALRRKWNR